jgi:Na+/melibiose symporter-like transporter
MERTAVRGMNLTGRRLSWKTLAGGLCGGLSGIAALPISAWAQERSWDWGWHPMWGMWGAWGVGMMLFMLLFWVLVVVGVVLGIRWARRRTTTAASSISPRS